MKCPSCDGQITRKQINSFYKEEKEKLKKEFETAHADDLKKIRKVKKIFGGSFLTLLFTLSFGISLVLAGIIFFKFDPPDYLLGLVIFGAILSILCMGLEAHWEIREDSLFRKYQKQHSSE